MKVRTQLEVKRKSGQYIGAFAVYGYLKDETDKNRLVADEYAADVVRDIFKWKLEGMSPQDIAARLNHSGVLSPMEYKRSLGMRFATSFKANPQAAWSVNAVLRILKIRSTQAYSFREKKPHPATRCESASQSRKANGQSFRTPTKLSLSAGTLTAYRRRYHWILAAAPAIAPCSFSAAWCSAASAAQAWCAKPFPPAIKSMSTTSAPRTSRINPVRPTGCATRRWNNWFWTR